MKNEQECLDRLEWHRKDFKTASQRIKTLQGKGVPETAYMALQFEEWGERVAVAVMKWVLEIPPKSPLPEMPKAIIFDTRTHSDC